MVLNTTAKALLMACTLSALSAGMPQLVYPGTETATPTRRTPGLEASGDGNVLHGRDPGLPPPVLTKRTSTRTSTQTETEARVAVWPRGEYKAVQTPSILHDPKLKQQSASPVPGATPTPIFVLNPVLKGPHVAAVNGTILPISLFAPKRPGVAKTNGTRCIPVVATGCANPGGWPGANWAWLVSKLRGYQKKGPWGQGYQKKVQGGEKKTEGGVKKTEGGVKKTEGKEKKTEGKE
ncbi:hypothetical protein HRG_010529 [Hirsutella rhossiliensis]|uniref:Uncharacterized protein n=1 Tax=Hirsutella rhossiliensis TaxID=111463 RepID=A0A9P8MKZ5_9HYPO|nr:uncharacterized protein HRG_10529 [Hirsutella rhossiliensis]KAH0958228.1 hypothetical protein HRG_10529 [Hirsutella rhossiliensis]